MISRSRHAAPLHYREQHIQLAELYPTAEDLIFHLGTAYSKKV
jgi:hypothetical protein